MPPSRSQTRWPVGAAMICLGIGALAGTWGRLVGERAIEHAPVVEALSGAALIICLYCTGLELSVPFDSKLWRVPLRLAAITLPITIALIAGVAHLFLGLSIEHAVLLGAVLAPTDPVLAARLELRGAHEAGQEGATRFALMAEGAMSSILAPPLVLFALGLCGHRDLGAGGWRWLILDFAWPLACAALLGWAAGAATARLLARLDSRAQPGLLEPLLAVSVLALACGAAFVLQVSPFVTALAAGAGLARGGKLVPRPTVAPSGAARLARSLAGAAGHAERLAELAIVALLGALLVISATRAALILFALLLLVAVRPVAARLGLGVSPRADVDRHAIAWFGLRGVASVYCLMLAIDQDLDPAFASRLAAITLTVLATSIALHGLTALPLGNRPAGARS